MYCVIFSTNIQNLTYEKAKQRFFCANILTQIPYTAAAYMKNPENTEPALLPEDLLALRFCRRPFQIFMIHKIYPPLIRFLALV